MLQGEVICKSLMGVERSNGKLVSSTVPTEVVKTSFNLLSVSSENKSLHQGVFSNWVNKFAYVQTVNTIRVSRTMSNLYLTQTFHL